MSRKKKTNDAELTVTWTKELPKIGKSKGARKYLPIVEKLAENPGKLALLVTGLTPGGASSRCVSLRSAAQSVKGDFRFPVRRNIDDGLYSVYGICEG